MSRSGPRHTGPILTLDRWQLTGALLGLGLMVAVVFFAGVVVGRQSTAPLPPEVARIVAPNVAAAAATPHGDRSRVMAEVQPSTSAIDADLARPLADVVPRDKADAARVETHRQLQRSRASGIVAATPAEAADALRVVPPAAALASNPDGRVGFTLQVSAFNDRDAADTVAAELIEGGHSATVREVRAGGRGFFRVEVGFFDTDAQAAAFQRRFERDCGLSTVRVPVP